MATDIESSRHTDATYSHTDATYSARAEIEDLMKELLRASLKQSKSLSFSAETHTAAKTLNADDLNSALALIDTQVSIYENLREQLHTQSKAYREFYISTEEIIANWETKCNMLCSENSYLKARIAILEEAFNTNER